MHESSPTQPSLLVLYFHLCHVGYNVSHVLGLVPEQRWK
jgi:hypothetical protein